MDRVVVVGNCQALALEMMLETNPFKIRGESYQPERAVRAFFDYYAAHPHLVELNLAPQVA